LPRIQTPVMVVQIEDRVLDKVARPIERRVAYRARTARVDGIAGTAPRRNELGELQFDEQRGEINPLYSEILAVGPTGPGKAGGRQHTPGIIPVPNGIEVGAGQGIVEAGQLAAVAGEDHDA